MSGFDNGTLQGGVFSQAKQFGSVLRGNGPPVPGAGLQGDLYLDTLTWFLYEKRSSDVAGDVDPWGHYLFQVPATYQSTLKWFGPALPTNDIGVIGDYCLAWAGFGNYGLQPSVYGPKTANGWQESGEGPSNFIGTLTSPLPVGAADEGAAMPFGSYARLIAVGANDEYSQPTISTTTVTDAGSLAYGLGAASGPASVSVTLNTLYTAEDAHSV